MEFNFYLNQDDNDILEWEDLVPFDPTNSYDYDTPQLKYWKNAYWSVRWRFRNNEIFAFVGINNCLNLPDDWVLKYKYSFGLCPISGDPSLIEWTDTLHHTFTKPAMDYEDYSTARFPSISFILQNSDKYVTQDNRLILKCRLEAVPIPFAIRQGYDSRKTTGMVGLDNLGATCYLNALLQVDNFTFALTFQDVVSCKFVSKRSV